MAKASEYKEWASVNLPALNASFPSSFFCFSSFAFCKFFDEVLLIFFFGEIASKTHLVNVLRLLMIGSQAKNVLEVSKSLVDVVFVVEAEAANEDGVGIHAVRPEHVVGDLLGLAVSSQVSQALGPSHLERARRHGDGQSPVDAEQRLPEVLDQVSLFGVGLELDKLSYGVLLLLDGLVGRFQSQDAVDGFGGRDDVAQRDAALGDAHVTLDEVLVQLDSVLCVDQSVAELRQHHMTGGSVSIKRGSLRAQTYDETYRFFFFFIVPHPHVAISRYFF